jgi:hypothetical protein
VLSTCGTEIVLARCESLHYVHLAKLVTVRIRQVRVPVGVVLVVPPRLHRHDVDPMRSAQPYHAAVDYENGVDVTVSLHIPCGITQIYIQTRRAFTGNPRSGLNA